MKKRSSRYRLVIHRRPGRFLERAPREVAARLLSALYELRERPRHGDRHLKGEYHCLWRRRVGDLRVVYSVSDREKLIVIVEICWRERCY